jgi:predicted nucleic acid-binding protein
VSDVWVVNASPIIVLAKVDRLHLLRDLSKELLIPEVVATEVLAGPPSDPARHALERGWGPTITADQIAPDLLEWGLGVGETAVLAVAIERRPATAVLDDAAARTCARALGIEVIGTLGVVLRAKKKALIPSAADVLKSLRAAGFRLDDSTIRSALQGVGETWVQET